MIAFGGGGAIPNVEIRVRIAFYRGFSRIGVVSMLRCFSTFSGRLVVWSFSTLVVGVEYNKAIQRNIAICRCFLLCF